MQPKSVALAAAVTVGVLAATGAMALVGPGPTSARGPASRNRAVLERRRGEDESGGLVHRLSKVGNPGDESAEALTAAEQFAQARTAPGTVAAGAYGAAYTSLVSLPTTGGTWFEVTNKPYNSDDPNYRDPVNSNSSGGAGLVSGRMTGLAVGGNGYVYAAGADGGVFRSTDQGGHWTAIADGLPTLSVGDLKIAPDGSLWLATGEGNTGSTSYVGSGVYRLANPATGQFSIASRVGGAELESTFINKIKFDDAGHVYAATSRGLWRHSASASNVGAAWENVFMPTPGSTDPYMNIVNDVEVQPGTTPRGQNVLANAAWRGGATYNGFYLSTAGGAAGTFKRINPQGAINGNDIGNGEFAYSADGKKLYTVLESVQKYTFTVNTVLSGVYVSPSGSLTGPWNKIAESQKFAGSGSALKLYQGYRPGVQAWYNNFIAVDPANSSHVYVGLEEVYETTNGGTSWNAIAPYWNFEFDCWSMFDASNTCPMAPHSDQHSIAFGNGKVYIGNDGGIYARPINGQVNGEGHATDWVNLNANLRTLQYYGVGVGKVGNGYAVSGGLQDNGGSLLLPGASTMVSPVGGDGGMVVVDPDDGCKILHEYTNLALEMTNNCGRTDGTTSAVRDVAPADPNARFIAPFVADSYNKNHLVAGGQYIWTYAKGFQLQTGSEWTKAFDLGAPHQTTAVDSGKDVVYAAWCGPCNTDAGVFARGVATNYGGKWHQLALPATVPNRYIAGVAVDPADATGATAYLAMNGFSRRWTEGPGAGYGHVFKTTDGGVHWTDVSGNMPDIPANDIVVTGSGSTKALTVATDLGVLRSTDGGATWRRFGSSLPLTTVMDLSVAPDGNVYAATHGRGIWKVGV